jgi:hypothetical protein
MTGDKIEHLVLDRRGRDPNMARFYVLAHSSLEREVVMEHRTFTQSILALSAAPLLAYPDRASAAAEPAGRPLLGGAITDVPGIKVSHHAIARRPTGCAVILCEDGAVGGVDVRGTAPEARETDLLDPTNAVLMDLGIDDFTI